MVKVFQCGPEDLSPYEGEQIVQALVNETTVALCFNVAVDPDHSTPADIETHVRDVLFRKMVATRAPKYRIATYEHIAGSTDPERHGVWIELELESLPQRPKNAPRTQPDEIRKTYVGGPWVIHDQDFDRLVQAFKAGATIMIDFRIVAVSSRVLPTTGPVMEGFEALLARAGIKDKDVYYSTSDHNPDQGTWTVSVILKPVSKRPYKR